MALCRLFGVSKQAYYQWKDSDFYRLSLERFIIEYVRDIRLLDPKIGGEKLWFMYKSYFGSAYSIGRDAFLRILKQYNLLLRKHKSSTRTTNSSHGFPLYPDLIKNLLISRPYQVFVSDITYIPTHEGFCFLSLVTDAYTREIVGWFVGPTLEAVFTLEALKMACRNLPDTPELIHHSDRGVQYACGLYVSYLKNAHIQISMTQSGDPKDNAIAERVNGILKTEFLNHHQLENIAQVRCEVEKAVDFYNNQRPHRSLDMMTPVEAREKEGHINKRWKSYKDAYRSANG